MHALIVTPAFPPYPGGGERYARSLALNLASRSVKITVLTTTAARESDLWAPASEDRPVTYFEEDGPLRVVRCPTKAFPGGFKGLLAWRKAMVVISSLPGNQSGLLTRMASKVPTVPNYESTLEQIGQHVDLIHGFNLSWENSLALGYRFAGRKGIPFVITPFLHTGEAGGDKVSRNTTMDHQLALLNEAQSVQTLTNRERAFLAQQNVRPGHLLTVGSGLDPIPRLDQTSLDWVNFRTSSPYVSFIGRASYDKGAFDAIEAVKQLIKQDIEIDLRLAGQTTPEFNRFLKKAEPAVRRRIKHLGVVTESQKHALLARSLMLILPSRTDSFGIVLLEAWAHGIPVIGAQAGGITEVISDGVDGFLVRFGDPTGLASKIRRLMLEPSLRDKMAANGQRKLVNIYNWDVVADNVLENYRQILS